MRRSFKKQKWDRLLDLAKQRLAEARTYHDQENGERTRQALPDVFNIVEDLERNVHKKVKV